MSRFNLDAIAGQAPSEQVQHAMRQARLIAWADPQSLHYEGKQAANLLEVSRESVAQGVGVSREQIAFRTNTADAVRAVLESVQPSAILYSAIERKAVTDAIADSDLPTTALAVDSDGRVDPQDLVQKLSDAANIAPSQGATNFSNSSAPAAVFVQWANQEIGTVQWLSDLYTCIQEARAVLVMDATSALGYLPTDEVALHWDYLIADSASWGGSRVATILGTAESSVRFADTTSVAEATSAAVALDSLLRRQPAESQRLAQLRGKFENWMANKFEPADLIKPTGARLPHVVTFSIPYVDAEALAVDLDKQGVAIGSGSACANETGVPSHVLAAIGRLTQGNVRISLTIDCPEDAIDRLIELLPQAVAELTSDLSLPLETTAGRLDSRIPDPTTNNEIAIELDERGQLCPHPVIELAKAAKLLNPGMAIGISTDDPAALNDIPAWARLQSATILSQESVEPGVTRFVLRLS